MRTVEEYLANGEVFVEQGTFAVVKAKTPIPEAFALVQDTKEITAVLDQAKLDQYKESIKETDKDWNIITFDTLLPIDMVGFIATVANALKEEGISILVISGYSTDHILVQTYDLRKALKKLESLGCRIKT